MLIGALGTELKSSPFAKSKWIMLFDERYIQKKHVVSPTIKWVSLLLIIFKIFYVFISSNERNGK